VRNEAYKEAAQQNTPVPPMTTEGNSEAKKLGAELSSWKDTVIGRSRHCYAIKWNGPRSLRRPHQTSYSDSGIV
jgi:hypothetical protein